MIKLTRGDTENIVINLNEKFKVYNDLSLTFTVKKDLDKEAVIKKIIKIDELKNNIIKIKEEDTQALQGLYTYDIELKANNNSFIKTITIDSLLIIEDVTR